MAPLFSSFQGASRLGCALATYIASHARLNFSDQGINHSLMMTRTLYLACHHSTPPIRKSA